MATELSDASLKLVLDVSETREAVHEIEREQQRRRGLRRPGYAAPDEVQPERPDLGRSAVTGEREGPLPTPGGDARPSGSAGSNVLDAGADEVQRIVVGAQRAVSTAESIIGSPGSGAAALGTELARGGTMAAARAAGVAGPVGVALAAGAMTAQGLASAGPSIGGFARGLGGATLEGVVSYALTGSPNGLAAWRTLWDETKGRIDAIDSTVSDMTEIAAAQTRVGGRSDSRALARFGVPIYQSHAQFNVEDRARIAAEERLRSEAGGRFIKDGLDRFIGQ